MRIRVLLPLLLMALPSPARAWETHRSLMQAVLHGVQEDVLDRPIEAPCADDDLAQFQKLASEFLLNRQPKDGMLPTSPEACARKKPITGRDVLLSFSVDEPDMGMDQDLTYPVEQVDPEGFQKWMGGTTGPSSQGFRHMYFAGWQLWHPINTFQIPTHAVGYGVERAAMMAQKARALIRAGGKQAAWGFRVLGWAIHYVQDLAQPFHAAQVPHFRMVPWYAAMEWPPSQGFHSLVTETTRTISNYHWAFEEYTLMRVRAPSGEHSPYEECLAQPDEHAPILQDPRKDQLGSDPHLLAERTARASVALAPSVGKAMVRFFGPGLKARSVDLRQKKGIPNYADYIVRPDLVEPRDELTRVTCSALGNASWSTRALIHWALAQ